MPTNAVDDLVCGSHSVSMSASSVIACPLFHFVALSHMQTFAQSMHGASGSARSSPPPKYNSTIPTPGGQENATTPTRKSASKPSICAAIAAELGRDPRKSRSSYSADIGRLEAVVPLPRLEMLREPAKIPASADAATPPALLPNSSPSCSAVDDTVVAALRCVMSPEGAQ